MTIWHGRLKVKDGKREEYVQAIKDAGLIEKFRSHPGNVFYTIGASVTDENELIVCDGWEDHDAFVKHDTSADVDVWREIYARYVTDCVATLYEAQPQG